ncbi:unnamed protein product [Pleuronectes platessa]|uniref:Uncharacterized protein n=1 Tax=Pleuronectes platessa TaxID=8262 RepID=A0A9N7Z9T9_PLEPL|nr:unnamed protein product [Pleuronectes platessa]
MKDASRQSRPEWKITTIEHQRSNVWKFHNIDAFRTELQELNEVWQGCCPSDDVENPPSSSSHGEHTIFDWRSTNRELTSPPFLTGMGDGESEYWTMLQL